MEIVGTVQTTAVRLAEVLSAKILMVGVANALEGYNRGCYPGTDLPVRQIDPHVRLTVHSDGRVEDEVGGWVADRFCASSLNNVARLGRRDTVAVFSHFRNTGG